VALGVILSIMYNSCAIVFSQTVISAALLCLAPFQVVLSQVVPSQVTPSHPRFTAHTLKQAAPYAIPLGPFLDPARQTAPDLPLHPDSTPIPENAGQGGAFPEPEHSDMLDHRPTTVLQNGHDPRRFSTPNPPAQATPKPSAPETPIEVILHQRTVLPF
jgi:hypothetical protein